ncbi:hypothetical protein Dimus_030853 [Dionaea muscipula]
MLNGSSWFEKSIVQRRWAISCFRKEEFSPEKNLKPEVIEDVFSEELVKPQFDSSKVVQKDWITVLPKAADAVFRVIGSRWIVPWTGETILQHCLRGSANPHHSGPRLNGHTSALLPLQPSTLSLSGPAIFGAQVRVRQHWTEEQEGGRWKTGNRSLARNFRWQCASI